MRSLRILVPATLLVLVAVSLAGSSEDVATDTAYTPSAKPVRVDQVTPAGAASSLWFPGVSRAAQRAELSFSIAGRLVERRPAEGDAVRKGDLLARIDVREQAYGARAADASVAEAEVRLSEARRDQARVVGLVDQGAATREELESLDAVVAAAAAAVDAARARQADATRRRDEGVLRAPFDGTVTEVRMEPGEYAPAGRPVLEIAGDGGVEVLLQVPETLAMNLAVDVEVKVRSAVLGATYGAGRVQTIGRAGGARGSLFPVVVALSADVPVGVSVEIALSPGGGSKTSMTVPVEAVVDPAGVGPVVFRLRAEGGQASVVRVPVAVGALIAGRVVVDGALTTGDEVVVAGQRGLLDGDAVEIVR